MSDSIPTTPTDADFLASFPEFNDSSKYPATQRQLWMAQALATLDKNRWCDFYVMGCYLYVAHHLALFSNQNGRRGVPGRPPMLMSSKSVGSVSASYDTQSIAVKDGALWNATTYGIRWLQIARMVGSGGAQVGYGPMPPYYGPGFFGPR